MCNYKMALMIEEDRSCVCVCVRFLLKLTFHVRGSPAAPSCLGERAPSWLSGDCCARRLCRKISLHNGGYMSSTGSETDLKEEFNSSSIVVSS